MILIAALDDKNGMMFNHRRQSQDSQLRAHILKQTEDSALWMNAYSAKQFGACAEHPPVHVSESFLTEAGGAYCFVENVDIAPYMDRVEKIIIYRWNRVYPRDQVFPVDFSQWKRTSSTDFAGSSHEKITEEVYEK